MLLFFTYLFERRVGGEFSAPNMGCPCSKQWFNRLCHKASPCYTVSIQLPANEHPGRQQVMVEVFGSLPPTWDARLSFRHGCCRHLGSEPADGPSLSISCHANNLKRKKCRILGLILDPVNQNLKKKKTLSKWRHILFLSRRRRWGDAPYLTFV